MSPFHIVIFTIAGIVIAVKGWRGKAMPAGPRCARCGYDLRGFAEAGIARCSECGNELSQQGAVARNTRQRSPKRVIAGLAVVALPLLLIPTPRIIQFVGPHGEGLLSNRSLIDSLANEPDRSWQWVELARRLDSGRLGTAEAAPAVDVMAMYLKSRHPIYERLCSAEDFIQAADRAGAISPAQYLNIAEAYYDIAPRVELPSPVPAGARHEGLYFSYDTAGRPWRLADNQFFCQLRAMWLTAAPADSPDAPSQNPDAQSAPVNLLANGFRVERPSVPGDYQITFVFDMSMRSDDQWSTVPGCVPAARLAQWTSSVKLPLKILAPVE